MRGVIQAVLVNNFMMREGVEFGRYVNVRQCKQAGSPDHAWASPP